MRIWMASLLAGLWLPAVAHAGVLINEILPNPSGTDGGSEWIELYNDDTVAVDLTDWSIQKATSTYSEVYVFPSGTTIAAGGYLVVGEYNVTTADIVLGTSELLAMGNASSSADAVRLLDDSATVRDTVIYGTPNSDGFEDDTGATATSMASKPSDDSSLARVPNGTDTDDSGADFTLTSSPTMGTDNGSGTTDTGDTGTGETGDTSVSGVCDPAGDVTINEFMANPSGADDGTQEWVELYNIGAAAVDLSGWKLVGGTASFGTLATLPSGTTIEAGGFLVLAESEAVAVWDVLTGKLSLGNAGTSADAVRLEDCLGAVADTVVYGTENSDGWIDDTGAIATSFAPKPVEGSSTARIEDGWDTDLSADDFEIASWATPGASNGSEAEDCGGPDSGLKVNEFLSNPAGSDTGAEWVELYHAGTETLDLSGWALQAATKSFSSQYTFEDGFTMEPGSFLLIGGELVAGADLVAESLSLGNGTGADGVRVVDCRGFAADTVLYGTDNSEDQLVDDTGEIGTSLAAAPTEELSAARVEDGLDTDLSADDFATATWPTPGYSNTTEIEDCGGPDSGLKLNEFLSNPVGTDTGAEWVELYHAGEETLDLSDWRLQTATSSFKTAYTFEAGATIAPGEYLLLGGELVAGVDILVESLSLGNGTGADGIRIVDCRGFTADTVLYGTDNSEDQLVDDSGEVATSLATPPAEARSLQRLMDGWDTDLSGDDWTQSAEATPGSANPEVEPVVCVPSSGGITLNEVLYDQDGSDDGTGEWVELYNSTEEAVSIAGWWISAGTKDFDDVDASLPAGATIEAGGFYVIGGSLVEEADYVEALKMGNGTGGDGVRLFDCDGTGIDTVLYGADSEDGLTDDLGEVVDPYGKTSAGQSIARLDDGVDSDAAGDWFVARSPTPGAANASGTGGGGEDPISPGCGCNRNAPDESAPDAEPTQPGEGCSTVPGLPPGSGALLLGLVLAWRRRR